MQCQQFGSFTATAAGQDLFPELTGHSTGCGGKGITTGMFPKDVLERAQILHRV